MEPADVERRDGLDREVNLEGSLQKFARCVFAMVHAGRDRRERAAVPYCSEGVSGGEADQY